MFTGQCPKCFTTNVPLAQTYILLQLLPVLSHCILWHQFCMHGKFKFLQEKGGLHDAAIPASCRNPTHMLRLINLIYSLSMQSISSKDLRGTML